MLTYADVCRGVQRPLQNRPLDLQSLDANFECLLWLGGIYMKSNMLTSADVCLRLLTHADILNASSGCVEYISSAYARAHYTRYCSARTKVLALLVLKYLLYWH